MIKKLNVGIIGTGSIADDQHAPALRSNGRAVCHSILSRDYARGREFAEKHKTERPIRVFTKMDEFLSDDELDAVIITTPDRLHYAAAMECARSKKHVLLEKPMTTTVGEAQNIQAAFEQNGLRLAIGFHLRFHVGHRILHRLISEGGLGNLHHIRVHWTFRAPHQHNWRATEELGRWWSLAANGSHCLDLIRWMGQSDTGSLSKTASIITREVYNAPHDETAIVSMQFNKGMTAISSTSVLFDSQSRLEIYGEKGCAVCDGTLGRTGQGVISVNGADLSFSPRNPFEAQLEDFVRAVCDGVEPSVGASVGVQSVEDLCQVGGI